MQSFALQWEFPGGKVEAGEKLEAALGASCARRLGIGAVVEQEIATVKHEYAEGLAVELHFFLVREFAGDREQDSFARCAGKSARRWTRRAFWRRIGEWWKIRSGELG